MPRQGKPLFDKSRNQWILRHRRERHYLCSGVENYALALQKASQILGGVPVITERPTLVCELVEAWLTVVLRWTAAVNWTRSGTDGFLGRGCARGRERISADRPVALILMGDWNVPAEHDSHDNEDRDAYREH